MVKSENYKSWRVDIETMVLKNVELYRDSKIEKVDIEVIDGVISAVDKSIDNKDSIDCTGTLLLNGVTDLSIYPKDRKIANIQDTQQRAFENGVTELVIQADLDNLVDREERLTLLKSMSFKGVNSRYLFSGVDKDENLTNISILSKYGDGVSIKSDIDGNQLRRVFEYAQMLNLPLFVKIQNREINSDGLLHNTERAFKLGMPTRHESGEIIEVAKIIELSKLFKVKTVLQGVTEKRAIDIIEKAKSEGAQLFLEVSIHHLINSDKIYNNFNNYTKIEPPFQSEDNRLYLLESLKKGVIDSITAGHLEVSQSFKSGSFRDAENGVCGFDSYLSIIYTELVQSGIISESRFVALLSSSDSIFGDNSTSIEVGSKASFTLFRRDRKVKISNQKSIYLDREFSGESMFTICRNSIYSEKE